MYVLSFYRFLTSAELLELRRRDIVFQTDLVKIYISKTETDQIRKGHTLAITKTGGQLCSVKLLQSYFSKVNISADFTIFKNSRKLNSSEKHISLANNGNILKLHPKK